MYARLPHCLYGAYNHEINAKIKISIGSVIITAEDYQLFIFHRKVHSIPRHILSFLEVLAELINGNVISAFLICKTAIMVSALPTS